MWCGVSVLYLGSHLRVHWGDSPLPDRSRQGIAPLAMSGFGSLLVNVIPLGSAITCGCVSPLRGRFCKKWIPQLPVMDLHQGSNEFNPLRTKPMTAAMKEDQKHIEGSVYDPRTGTTVVSVLIFLCRVSSIAPGAAVAVIAILYVVVCDAQDRGMLTTGGSREGSRDTSFG